MATEKYILTKGVIKVHDGKPIKSGESVISPNLFAKIVESVPTDAVIDKEKDKTKKDKLKEEKLISSMLKVTDERTKKEIDKKVIK
jgi:hypothetical protein